LELPDILELATLFQSIAPLLIQIVETNLQFQNPREDFIATCANSSWVLAACMHTLSRYDPDVWRPQVDLSSWTQKAVEKFGWSEDVIAGLVRLLGAGCVVSPLFFAL
jgi:U3 small nucleolar RNA-associated protein 20